MPNTIKSETGNYVKTYDLKGSRVNRVVHRDEGKKQTMKDLNLLQCRSYRLKKGIPGIL